MKLYTAGFSKLKVLGVFGGVILISIVIFFIFQKKVSNQISSEASPMSATTTLENKPFYTEEVVSNYPEKNNFYFVVSKGGDEKNGFAYEIHAFDITKNPVTKRIVKTFRLPEDIDDPLLDTAAQYSSKSDSFYVRTATCIQEEYAICVLEHYSIYKINMSSSSPVKVFESVSGVPTALVSWEMSSSGDYLYVEQGEVESDLESPVALYKIDTVSNLIQKAISYDDESMSKYYISRDGKFIFLRTLTNSRFILKKYDSFTFESLGQIEIPVSEEDLVDLEHSELSPNGRYITYFSNTINDKGEKSSTTTIVVFDTKNSTSKLYMIDKQIYSFFLYWSVDSTKVILQLSENKDRWSSKSIVLDVVTGSTTDVDKIGSNTFNLVLSGGDYIYMRGCNKTTLFNLVKNSSITFTYPVTTKNCSYLPGYGMY